MGASVKIAGPPTLIPPQIEKLGVEVFYNVDAAIEDVDVIMCLRLQRERQSQNLIPSLREFSRFFGINQERLKKTKDKVVIMHPGPINRGVEINSEVAEGKNSIILKQVSNGVVVRMAIFYLLALRRQNVTY